MSCHLVRAAFLAGTVAVSAMIPAVAAATDASPAVSASAAFTTPAATSLAHDRAYWESIKSNGFAVPPEAKAFDLAIELAAFSNSPDRDLRDGIGFEITAEWVYQKRIFNDADLGRLVAVYETNLAHGIGETGTNSVFGRSFSALNLSTLVALDNEMPFLAKPEFDTLLAAAIGYLAAERDLRGFDAKLGWVHSAAHTGDLLKFLARSRHLDPAGQRRILDAVSAKMAARIGHVFNWGEDERLARAVVSVIARKDLDTAGFDAWLGAVPRVATGLWEKPASVDLVQFAAVQNTKNLLKSLFAILSSYDELTPQQSRAKESVLKTITAIGG